MPAPSPNARVFRSLELADLPGLRAALAAGADPNARHKAPGAPDGGPWLALAWAASQAVGTPKAVRLWPLMEELIESGATILPQGPGPFHQHEHPLAVATVASDPAIFNRLLARALLLPDARKHLNAPVWHYAPQWNTTRPVSLLDLALLSGHAPNASSLLNEGVVPLPSGPCAAARASARQGVSAKRPSTLACALSGPPSRQKSAILDVLLSHSTHWPGRDLDHALRLESLSPTASLERVRALLARGASPRATQPDANGVPLLPRLIIQRPWDCVGDIMGELVHAGADQHMLVDFDPGRPPPGPGSGGPHPILEVSVRNLVPTSPNHGTLIIRGANLLGLAAFVGNAASVSRLLAAGARVDHAGHQQATALHLACLGNPERPARPEKHGHCIDALLHAGADPGAGDNAGRTPLEYWLAERRGQDSRDPIVLATAKRLLQATLAACPDRAASIDKLLPVSPDPKDELARALRAHLERWTVAHALDCCLPRSRPTSTSHRL